MKFWGGGFKNFTEAGGRFIYEGLKNSPGGAEFYAENREEAMADTKAILAKLKEEITIEDQVEILVRIARNESLKDTADEDERRGKYYLDKAGEMFEERVTDGTWALTLEKFFDRRSEAGILKALQKPAKLKFLADYGADAFNLFTDQQGEREGGKHYRVDFYGDSDLSVNASLMDLLDLENPDQQVVLKEGVYYARTEIGYLGFYPTGSVGERAIIGSADEFTTLSVDDLVVNAEVSEALSDAKTKNPQFANIEDNELMAEKDYNRRSNLYTGQSWKNFADKIVDNPEFGNLDFTKNIQEWFERNGTFRRFLDGNLYLKNGVDAAVIFEVPGQGRVGPLDGTMKPAEYQKMVARALFFVKNYVAKEMENCLSSIRVETNQVIREQMEENLEKLQSTLPNFLQSLDTFVAEENAQIEQVKQANTEIVLRWLKGKHEAKVAPEKVAQALNQFDEAIQNMATEGFDQEKLQAEMGLVLIRILELTPAESQIKLQENPRLEAFLRARVNTLSREPGITSVSTEVKIIKEEALLGKNLAKLAELDPEILADLNLNADLLTDKIDSIATLRERLQNRQKVLEFRIRNDDRLKAGEWKIYESLQLSISLLKKTQARLVKLQQEEQQTLSRQNEYASIVKAVPQILNVEENLSFYQTVEARVLYSHEYQAAHNGEVPPLTSEKFENTYRAFSAGASSTEVLQTIRLVENPTYQKLEQAQKERLLGEVENIPEGTNFVGITDSNEFLLAIPGVADEFIQTPGSKKIAAKKFANVPDFEDLKTENLYLAQIYSAFTRGSVFESPLRKIAQDAERNGSQASTKLIANYLTRANRSADKIMSVNEVRQWEQLGQMCQDYEIGIDGIFTRLSGAKRMDGTLNPNPTDNGTLLVALLETAVAGNKAGFEALMGINTPNRMN